MSLGWGPDGRTIEAILFDLDGTLLHTAPDLVGALNHLCEREGRKPVAVEDYQRYVSRGALGLIRAGLPDEGPDREAERRAQFLDWYEAHSLDGSGPFPGVEALLDGLDARGVPWGIVTNKPTYLTVPILAALGWDRRARAVVCGDTLSVAKPDPAPVLLASRACGVPVERCAMVGDDPRDLEAAERAGALPVLAAYGYGAQEVLDTSEVEPAAVAAPDDLLAWFNVRPVP